MRWLWMVGLGGCVPGQAWLGGLVDEGGKGLADGALRTDGVLVLAGGAEMDVLGAGYTLESSDPDVVRVGVMEDVVPNGAEAEDGAGAPAIWLPGAEDVSVDHGVVVAMRTGAPGEATIWLQDPDGVVLDAVDVVVGAPERLSLVPACAPWWVGLDDFEPRVLAGGVYSFDVVHYGREGQVLRGAAPEGPEDGTTVSAVAIDDFTELGVHEVVSGGAVATYEVVDPRDVVGVRWVELEDPGSAEPRAGLLVVGVDVLGRDVLGMRPDWTIGPAAPATGSDLYAYSPDAQGDAVEVIAQWGEASVAAEVHQDGRATMMSSGVPLGCNTGGVAGGGQPAGLGAALGFAWLLRRRVRAS